MSNNYFKDKYLTKKYFEAFDNRSKGGTAYTFAQIQALRDMAEHDVYPDGRFSDEECNIWSMFHCFHRKED